MLDLKRDGSGAYSCVSVCVCVCVYVGASLRPSRQPDRHADTHAYLDSHLQHRLHLHPQDSSYAAQPSPSCSIPTHPMPDAAGRLHVQQPFI